MYCVVTRYQAEPKNLDEVTRIFREEAAPLVSRQPGFKGVYLMTKPNGLFAVLNIWDTEEQANAWPQNPEHQKVAAGIRSLLSPMVRTSTRDVFEVPVHQVA